MGQYSQCEFRFKLKVYNMLLKPCYFLYPKAMFEVMTPTAVLALSEHPTFRNLPSKAPEFR